MKESNVAVIDEPTKEKKPSTDKKYLKRVDRFARRLDNIVNDLYELSRDAQELANASGIISTEVSEKDFARFTELAEVTFCSTQILYHLANRMARKYSGKDIEPIDQDKRKALKVN